MYITSVFTKTKDVLISNKFEVINNIIRHFILGQYQCFAENEWGIATSNSVFVRKSELNNFKAEPPKTLHVEEGKPYGIDCESPDGWPNPSVYWMKKGQNWLKTINSSRLTVDPEGKLWFSNITKHDASDDYLYACSAESYFRNEYKLGNMVHLQVTLSGSSGGLQNKHEPVQQVSFLLFQTNVTNGKVIRALVHN